MGVVVTYGLLETARRCCALHLAEHGRNLAGDPRASLVIAEVRARPIRWPRRASRSPAGRAAADLALAAARTAHLAAVPAATTYVDFADFSL